MAYTLFAEKNRVAWSGVRPGVYGEQVTIDSALSAVGSTTLYTVPAGKTLLLFNSWWAVEAGAAAGIDITYGVYDAVPALIYRLCRFFNAGGSVASALAAARWIPLEMPAGYSLRMSLAVGGSIAGGFEGILVDPLENV
jgi:hypothetical protein